MLFGIVNCTSDVVEEKSCFLHESFDGFLGVIEMAAVRPEAITARHVFGLDGKQSEELAVALVDRDVLVVGGEVPTAVLVHVQYPPGAFELSHHGGTFGPRFNFGHHSKSPRWRYIESETTNCYSTGEYED